MKKDIFNRVKGMLWFPGYLLVALLIVWLSAPKQMEAPLIEQQWETELLDETIQPCEQPTTKEDFLCVFRYMLANQEEVLTFQYPVQDFNRDAVLANSAEAYSEADKSWPEYSRYRTRRLSRKLSCDGKTYILTLTYNFMPDGQSMETNTRANALDVLTGLYEEGALTREMSEKERAMVLMSWVADRTEYSYTAENPRTAWAVFTRGEGVCVAYTSALNLLLRLDGIDCIAAQNSDHMWTEATLDGTLTYMDATYYDSFREWEKVCNADYSANYCTTDAVAFQVYHPFTA